MNIYRPAKYAADTGHEFDPQTENHHFGFLVKAVDPGCTMELQIEERSGRVTRLTSTNDPEADGVAFEAAVIAAFDRFMQDVFGKADLYPKEEAPCPSA